MTSEQARRFAEDVHAGALDRYGSPLLDHVRRVAADVSAPARPVAWLHETLECAGVTQDELRARGVGDEDLIAIALLTNAPGCSTEEYLQHVARIAAAPGRAGTLARTVKHADLHDRIRHQDPPRAGAPARPPYTRALALLREAASPRPGVRSSPASS